MPPTDSFDSPTRFTLRALARGVDVGAVARISGDATNAVEKRLRAAVLAATGTAPPRSADRATLLAAAAPLVDAARDDVPDAAATPCPARDVIRALGSGDLAGPLLLATLEHVADCAACMGSLLDSAEPEPSPPVAPPRAVARRSWLGVALLAVFVLLLWCLFAGPWIKAAASLLGAAR